MADIAELEARLTELLEAAKLAPSPRATEWSEDEWAAYGKAVTRLMDAGHTYAAIALRLAQALREIGYDDDLLACPGPPNCGGAGAHYESCPVTVARKALADWDRLLKGLGDG